MSDAPVKDNALTPEQRTEEFKQFVAECEKAQAAWLATPHGATDEQWKRVGDAMRESQQKVCVAAKLMARYNLIGEMSGATVKDYALTPEQRIEEFKQCVAEYEQAEAAWSATPSEATDEQWRLVLNAKRECQHKICVAATLLVRYNLVGVRP